MKIVIRMLLALAILAIFAFGAYKIASLKKEVNRRSKPRSLPLVEVASLKLEHRQVMIPSQGEIIPRRKSRVSSTQGGRLVFMAQGLEEGMKVTEGQLLYRLRDLEARLRLKEAEESLSSARLQLEQEKQLHLQARNRWSALKLSGNATKLALRQPQLERAEATLETAEARFEKAKDDLRETEVRAPHPGVVVQRWVVEGERVSPGQDLLELVDVGTAKVHLQVSGDHLLHLPPVLHWKNMPLHVDLGLDGKTYPWSGKVSQLLPELDPSTRRWVLVADVALPLEQSPPLAMDQFVMARIRGKEMKEVFVIPDHLVDDEGRIFSLSEDRRLVPHKLSPIWKQAGNWWVIEGLKEGMRICQTNLPFATPGLEVRLLGEEPEESQKENSLPKGGRPSKSHGGK